MATRLGLEVNRSLLGGGFPVVDLSESGFEPAGARGDGAADGASDVGVRALDVVLGCFAYEVGADTGQILGRENGDTRVVAIWALDGHERVEPWDSDGFLGRALAAGAASVDLDANGAGPKQPRRVRAVAAPILGDGSTLGVAYAGFIGSPRLGADELCWTADSYARMAAMCMTSQPETDVQAARPAAARAAAAASSAIHAATGESIEISVGVAEWDSYEAGEDLVERADRAMRAAKAAGGARVVADGPQGHRLDGLSELSSHLANALEVSRDRSRGR